MSSHVSVAPLTVALTGLVTLSLGCAQTNSANNTAPDIPPQNQLTLKRGNSWTAFGLDLPSVVSPEGNLMLEDDTLYGALRSRTLRVKISERSLSGQFGRTTASSATSMGQINLTLDGTPQGLKVEGTWGGGLGRLSVSAKGLQATVRAVASRRHDLSGGNRVFECQYNLDETVAAGVWVGASSCSGMAQPTQVIIPQGVRAKLTNAEISAVLFAMLSSPPLTPAERRGSRTDFSP